MSYQPIDLHGSWMLAVALAYDADVVFDTITSGCVEIATWYRVVVKQGLVTIYMVHRYVVNMREWVMTGGP